MNNHFHNVQWIIQERGKERDSNSAEIPEGVVVLPPKRIVCFYMTFFLCKGVPRATWSNE